ncbi:MAG: hypothetical protein WDN48_10745 [Pseudolabrys sp.]
MRNLPMLAYVWAIAFGALVIFFPGGVHICVACGSLLETVFAVVSIVIGIVGIANRTKAVV